MDYKSIGYTAFSRRSASAEILSNLSFAFKSI